MKKSALSNTDKDLIKRYILGGAGVGISAGAITSLLNHLNQLKEESSPDTSLDDDVLRLQVRTAQNKQASVGGSLAMTGGLLSTLGGYALIRRLYEDSKRKRMQEMLDQAQNQFIEVSDDEANLKSAATDRKPMSFTEFLTSSPLAISMLLGLGSGVAAHQFLKKTYPEIKSTSRTSPRRVILQDVQDEEDVKSASMEMVGRLLCSGLVKSADSDFLDLVSACGQGRASEFSDALCEFSAETALDLVKGASQGDATPETLSVGCAVAFSNPVISPLASSLAAAEYFESAPEWSKKASTIEDDMAESLIKIASICNEAFRSLTFSSEDAMWDWFETKEASLESILASARKLSEMKETPRESDSVDNTSEDSDAVAGLEDSYEEESDDMVDAVLSSVSNVAEEENK